MLLKLKNNSYRYIVSKLLGIKLQFLANMYLVTLSFDQKRRKVIGSLKYCKANPQKRVWELKQQDYDSFQVQSFA